MSTAQGSVFERHKFATIGVLMAVAVAITLVTLEFGFRIGRDLIKGSPWSARAENVDDDDLGWALNPEKKRVTKLNACGETVVRNSPAGRHFLKLARVNSSSSLRVLFIGDSFTQGTEVSSDGMYYEWFERLGAGRFAVSAAGMGGFNTVQQYRLLERVYAQAAPKIVFWQLTSNDVGENVYIGTDISSVQKPRLYYDLPTDSFVIRNPSLWLLQHSDLTKYLYGELTKIQRVSPFGLHLLTGWLSPPASLPQDEVVLQGLLVMERMVGKAVRSHPGTMFVGFAVDDMYENEYRAIFERQGAFYYAGMSAQMRDQGEGQRIDCAPVDSHWNHHGNKVAATLLLGAAERLLAKPLRSRQ